MENATDALKMSVAALVFMVALSITIIAFTKARQAATAILAKSDKQEYYNTENIRVSEDRLVGIETVIPTLYSYFKEGYTILFYDGRKSYNRDTQELEGEITPLTLYYSEGLESRVCLSTLLNKNDTRGEFASENNKVKYQRAIYGFDANDEDTRQEPWLHDEIHAKMFIQSFINNLEPDLDRSTKTGAPEYDMSRELFGSTSPNKLVNNKLQINFNLTGQNTFYGVLKADKLSNATDALFIERVGVYNVVTNRYDDGNIIIYNTDSSVTEFSNNETIQNEEGTQKRVIQYIYVGEK